MNQTNKELVTRANRKRNQSRYPNYEGSSLSRKTALAMASHELIEKGTNLATPTMKEQESQGR